MFESSSLASAVTSKCGSKTNKKIKIKIYIPKPLIDKCRYTRSGLRERTFTEWTLVIINTNLVYMKLHMHITIFPLLWKYINKFKLTVEFGLFQKTMHQASLFALILGVITLISHINACGFSMGGGGKLKYVN